jgi:pimeloyl-ACP methyl ester carboxylesterase
MLSDWTRLAGVLARARDLGGDTDPRCQMEKDRHADNGWVFDRFVPKKPSGGALLLVHGWTLRGKDDVRLQALAKSLAIAGIECLVPRLPGMATMAFAEADVVGLRRFLEDERWRLGVLGFSFGGSAAVLAASGCARQPRFILSVSAYGDLPATYQRSLDMGKQAPTDPVARESWIYLKLAMAWRQQAVVSLPTSSQNQLRDLLMAFCEGSQTEAACAFWERALRDIDWEAVDRRQQDPSVLRVLSPTDNPPQVQCPVVILHDKADPAVWPSEAEVLADAIRRGSPGVVVEVMVTDLLQHVRPGLLWRPGELWRLFRLLVPLVARGDSP